MMKAMSRAIRFIKLVFPATIVAQMLASCRPETGVVPGPSSIGLTVLVDSPTYHLHPAPGGYDVRLAATVVNETDHEAYIANGCPSYFLRRADSTSGTELYLGQYGCIEGG